MNAKHPPEQEYKTAKLYFRRYLGVAPFSHSLWRAREAAVVSRIPLRKPILDIGCGFGEFAGVLSKGVVEFGLDINQSDLVLAEQGKRYRRLIVADGRVLPFDNDTFNTVLSISTLEHIDSVQEVLDETHRVLRKGGLFVFTVPTVFLNQVLSIPTFLRRIHCSAFADWYVRVFHWVFKHQVIVSKSEWIRMVQRAGFTVSTCRGIISRREVVFFEYGLPFALPTQVFRRLFRKRLPWSPRIRVELLSSVFGSVFRERRFTDANILLVARKGA